MPVAPGIDAAGRTAIIAGSGLLPLKVAESLEAQGRPPFIVGIKDEADPTLYRYDHAEISLVEFRKLIGSMKAAGARNVILAGGVRGRPHFADLRLDGPTLAAIPRMIGALGRGDDALLRAFIGLVESYGFRVVGAHEIVPDLLAPPAACLTEKKPGTEDQRNIAIAREAARLIGVLDVGQGTVAVGGRIVALEGAEGTDAMLERIVHLRAARRIPRRGGVLVKCAKPTQDERADLPGIGLSTIENAARAGLSGIAVEAGKTFILGFGETVAAANENGIFIETFSSKRD
ncbi:LpxI family protein [Phyllobacterium salinisoli]|uniref:LpxI family protein n=1 Tax=Phyllobacterium salinisoli TaxID=1899321 RepID=A0A368K4M6_9HYPH|nr:LpxI family protein [Phyllobacterium salinisoli]RCS24336.1 LpxI family protein [Phyllobacterium salinisoli]